MAAVFALRWIISALSLAISIALIARGDVVIGVLLGALAVARMTMFVRIQQRRGRFRDGRRDGGPWPSGRWHDGP
jgi:hypothetical protein